MPSKQSLKNKTILITGASSGIGRACAYQLAESGARLVLASRRQQELTQIAEELKQKFQTESYCLTLDVSKQADVTAKLNSLPENFKAIDILINNAGLALGLEPIQQGNPQDWDVMIDTNVKGLLYMTRSLLPQMIERNIGHIVNIGSIAGHTVYPNGNVYCATKHAVAAITQAMRMDLFGTDIRVTTIDPGMVETDFSKVRFKGDSERAASVYTGVKALTPEDIADAIHYALTCPPHVNISEMILMPTAQASATQVKRN